MDVCTKLTSNEETRNDWYIPETLNFENMAAKTTIIAVRQARRPMSSHPRRTCGRQSLYSVFWRENTKSELCEVCQSFLAKLTGDVSANIQEYDDISELTESMRTFLGSPTNDRESRPLDKDDGGLSNGEVVNANAFYSRISFNNFGNKFNVLGTPSEDENEGSEDEDEGSEDEGKDPEVSKPDWDSDSSDDGSGGSFEKLKWSYHHYETFPLLRESANMGCGLCYQFLHSIDENDVEYLQKWFGENNHG